MLRSVAEWPKVVLGQIEQLATDVEGRHTKEIAGSGRGNLPEGTVQAQGCVLQDVVRIFPPMDSWIGPKHLTRQAAQTLDGTLKQLAASRFVAVAQTIEIRLDAHGVR